MNLAVLASVTGQPLPLLWHVWGAYGVVFTLLSYFVLVKALTRNACVALVSAALLCFLLGGINSYFRVAPWPGNMSYIVWYFLMAMAFMTVDRHARVLALANIDAAHWFGKFGFLRSLVSLDRGLLFLAALSVVLIYGLHPGALFWCLTGFVFFGVGLALRGVEDQSLRMDRTVFVPPAVLVLCGFLLWKLAGLFVDDEGTRFDWGGAVPLVPALLILLGVGVVSILRRVRARRGAYRAAWFVLLASLLYLVDWAHVGGLLQTQWENVGAYTHHLPRKVDIASGQALYLPSWGHQLRSGLLFSGLLALPLSLWLLIETGSRTSVFLAANVMLSMFTLTSPQMFTLFAEMIPPASVYRIQLLVFHPIVIGLAIVLLIERAKSASATLRRA